MSDLINREKLTFNISEALSHTPPELMHTSIVVERILNVIEEEEAVDAVEIVRCKECKYRYTFDCMSRDRTYDDWFCADGRKKDTCE